VSSWPDGPPPPSPSGFCGAGDEADRGWQAYLEELDRRVEDELGVTFDEQLEWLDVDGKVDYRNFTTGPGIKTIDPDPRYL
jgi:hypothetical protein